MFKEIKIRIFRYYGVKSYFFF
nr:maturase K [Laportea bulbifera]